MEDRLQTLLERTAEAWQTDVTIGRDLLSLKHNEALCINMLKSK